MRGKSAISNSLTWNDIYYWQKVTNKSLNEVEMSMIYAIDATFVSAVNTLSGDAAKNR